MKTITTQNEPDLDLKNRFFRDNLKAMAETKMLQTAKQEAENRLVINKYNDAKERERIKNLPKSYSVIWVWPLDR